MDSTFSDQPPRKKRDHDDYVSDDPQPRRRRQNEDEEDEPEVPKLGSLAQSARGKQLNQARWILIVIGVLSMLLNGFLFANAQDELRKEIDKELLKRGMNRQQVNPAQLKEIENKAMPILRLIYGVGAALGIVFLVCGIIVKLFPVPVTIISLVLYILATIGFGILQVMGNKENPGVIFQGAFIKIIIIIALIKAVQAAVAYEREGRLEQEVL